jgi:hypothetical protein
MPAAAVTLPDTYSSTADIQASGQPGVDVAESHHGDWIDTLVSGASS